MRLADERNLFRLSLENKVLTYFLEINEMSVDVRSILRDMGIESAGVYGMNNAGQFLLRFLERNGIECFGVDKNATRLNLEIKMYLDTDIWPEANIFIVAGEMYYNEIENNIRKRSNAQIVKASHFLEELLCIPINYR